jgi:hypothetical protein
VEKAGTEKEITNMIIKKLFLAFIIHPLIKVNLYLISERPLYAS